MRDIAAAMAGSKLVEINGAGHLPQLDRPEAMEAALIRHLKDAGEKR
jgi:pimeloyl-ACP methyl ester carboxylesterase